MFTEKYDDGNNDDGNDDDEDDDDIEVRSDQERGLTLTEKDVCQQ